MDQVKTSRSRRRIRWLALPERLRDLALARAVERQRNGSIRVIDIAIAREQRARRFAPQPGGAA